LDTILEEVNKYLKVLILPIPSQKYWRIALHHILFNMIRHVDNKSSGDNNYICKSLEEEHLLSKQLKDFSNLACERRIIFINETFKSNKPNFLLRPISITAQEAVAIDEKNMQKKELIAIINSLLNSINTSDHPTYCEL
ncbi:20916_t:CDS:2, partial [Gigaspora margarita]